MNQEIKIDEAKCATFAGIQFPFTHSTVRGAHDEIRMRYRLEIVCPFVTTLHAYPKLYPDTLKTLRTLFESGKAHDLTLQALGTIPVRCIEWEERAVVNGAIVTLRFREAEEAEAASVFA